MAATLWPAGIQLSCSVFPSPVGQLYKQLAAMRRRFLGLTFNYSDGNRNRLLETRLALLYWWTWAATYILVVGILKGQLRESLYCPFSFRTGNDREKEISTSASSRKDCGLFFIEPQLCVMEGLSFTSAWKLPSEKVRAYLFVLVFTPRACTAMLVATCSFPLPHPPSASASCCPTVNIDSRIASRTRPNITCAPTPFSTNVASAIVSSLRGRVRRLSVADLTQPALLYPGLRLS
jgi:hypothetical protein